MSGTNRGGKIRFKWFGGMKTGKQMSCVRQRFSTVVQRELMNGRVAVEEEIVSNNSGRMYSNHRRVVLINCFCKLMNPFKRMIEIGETVCEMLINVFSSLETSVFEF